MSPLSKFIYQCRGKSYTEARFTICLIRIDKNPLERARILETTPLFTKIHAELAASGQTAVPSNLDTDLHFICFVEAPEADFREGTRGTAPAHGSENAEENTGMRLVELDGDRFGPIDRGECKDLLGVRLFYFILHVVRHS